MDNNVNIIYNILKGSDVCLSKAKIYYGIALLEKEEITTLLDTTDDFETLISKVDQDLFADFNYKANKEKVNHDLLVGMLDGIFHVDPISVDAYYHPDIVDLPNPQKLGKMLVKVSEARLREIIGGQEEPKLKDEF